MAAFVSPFIISIAKGNQVQTQWISRPDERRLMSKRLLLLPPSCRMRNREGFQLPPRVPSEPKERRRAIELLGCYTQRKQMRPRTVAELESLVGQLPPNRLLAQQWKGAIQRDTDRANRKRTPTAFRHSQHLMQTLALSQSDRSVSRCFILLEAVRKRYLTNEAPNPKSLEELNKLLGSFPTTCVEAHRFIRALARMQRCRRKTEKTPPRVPVDSFPDLYQASMLLGSYAVRGSVGRQKHKLEMLVGAIPRNQNVAHSWQKLIKAAIRKKKRTEKKDKRREEIEKKRFERQLRKLRKQYLAKVEAQTVRSSSKAKTSHSLQHLNSFTHRNVNYGHNHERILISLAAQISDFFVRFCGRHR